MHNDGYKPPVLTVDAIIFQLIDNVLNVLLVKRRDEPFQGAWALPGGYNAAGETTKEATARVLKAKAGIELGDMRYIEQLFTFDTVARDPRGHAVSVSYMGLGTELRVKSSNSTQQPSFYPVDSLPGLAYDHADIINYALGRLRAKLTYTNAIFGLLPESFTLTELQSAYEAVFGRQFDKRNFRKKFLSLDLIEETGNIRQAGAHRPARLYQFNSPGLKVLERSFD